MKYYYRIGGKEEYLGFSAGDDDDLEAVAKECAEVIYERRMRGHGDWAEDEAVTVSIFDADKKLLVEDVALWPVDTREFKTDINFKKGV